MTQVVVAFDGVIRWIHDESTLTPKFDGMKIRRASHVEPETVDRWFADLSPVGGPRLGPFVDRRSALAAEWKWLAEHLSRLPSS